MIQFVDVGALNEFKRLLAHVGKDRTTLSALQWLLYPRDKGLESAKELENNPDFLLIIPAVALPSTRIIADIKWYPLLFLLPFIF